MEGTKLQNAFVLCERWPCDFRACVGRERPRKVVCLGQGRSTGPEASPSVPLCANQGSVCPPSLCPLHLSRSLGARVSGLVEEGAGFRVNAARTRALAGFRTGAVCRSVCGEDPDYAPDFSNSKMQKQEGPHSKATSDVKAL